jgi:hypothetical protein
VNPVVISEGRSYPEVIPQSEGEEIETRKKPRTLRTTLRLPARFERRGARARPDGYGVAKLFDRRVLSHGGGIEGFSTSIHRFPDDRVTVIVLSNYEAARTGPIARDLAAIAFGAKYELPVERVVVKVDPKIYDAYAGEYELAPGFVFTITREGDRLMMQATGQGKTELFPTSETNFFPKVVRADITFVKDAAGHVTHLVLNQGGRQMNAKKIK